jgi:hypothetical protein
VSALHSDGQNLIATIEHPSAEIVEHARAKRYRKISAAFFPPDSKSNPTPGTYYLRHVGFLGAASPAVKGMPDPQFAMSEWDLSDCQACHQPPPLPPGYSHDPEQLALYMKAKALQAANPGMAFLQAAKTAELQQQQSR